MYPLPRPFQQLFAVHGGTTWRFEVLKLDTIVRNNVVRL